MENIDIDYTPDSWDNAALKMLRRDPTSRWTTVQESPDFAWVLLDRKRVYGLFRRFPGDFVFGDQAENWLKRKDAVTIDTPYHGPVWGAIHDVALKILSLRQIRSQNYVVVT